MTTPSYSRFRVHKLFEAVDQVLSVTDLPDEDALQPHSFTRPFAEFYPTHQDQQPSSNADERDLVEATRLLRKDLYLGPQPDVMLVDWQRDIILAVDLSVLSLHTSQDCPVVLVPSGEVSSVLFNKSVAVFASATPPKLITEGSAGGAHTYSMDVEESCVAKLAASELSHDDNLVVGIQIVCDATLLDEETDTYPVVLTGSVDIALEVKQLVCCASTAVRKTARVALPVNGVSVASCELQLVLNEVKPEQARNMQEATETVFADDESLHPVDILSRFQDVNEAQPPIGPAPAEEYAVSGHDQLDASKHRRGPDSHERVGVSEFPDTPQQLPLPDTPQQLPRPGTVLGVALPPRLIYQG